MEMSMQPVGVMSPAVQPLLHQPASMVPSPGYPIYMAQPPAAAPVQNNTATQSVVINQPGSSDNDGKKKRLFVDPEGVRGWSTGLFGCLDDIGSCFCACFFYPCMMCRVSNRMKECAFVFCTIPGGMTALRVRLRTLGGIKGSIFHDCLVVNFCTLCAACQMSRELDSMGL